MTDVFTPLAAVLLEGESLTFKVSRRGENLVALLIPTLPNAPKETSPDIENARVALSHHLRLDMSPSQLDREFADRVLGYATVRRDIRAAHDVILDELREARKATQAAASRHPTKRRATPALPAPPPTALPEARPDEDDEHTDSPSPPETPREPDSTSSAQQPLSLFDTP